MSASPLFDFIVLALFLVLVYLYLVHDFVRSVILSRKEFKCLRCGQCCRLKLRLYPDDINKIRRAGHKDFLDGKYMKQINGYCKFLKIDAGLAQCKLQKIKPVICREFPRKSFLRIPTVDTRCEFYRKK